MKKIYLIAILSLFALVSLGQYTTTQTLGAPATNVKSRGGLAVDSSYTQGGFTDTVAANLGFIKNIPFTQIRIGTNYWMRNSSATRWILITGGSGTICAGLQSGGNVAWTNTGLIFSVTEALYCINGSSYHSPTTNITLNAADPSLPRLDVLAVDVNNNVVKITGTPSATPSVPTVDPLTQLYLTAILVPAGATTPGGITTTIIYDENTEWATSSNLSAGSVNFNSIVTPFHLTKNAVLNPTASGTISFQQTSLSLNLSSYNNFTLYIKMDIANPLFDIGVNILNNGASISTSSLNLINYGFNPNITTYQTITIPATAFPVISNTFNGVLLKTASITGTNVHIDYIQLQSGVPSGSSSPYITNVRRRAGTDSVEVQKNGIWIFAFIDSTGGGGGSQNLQQVTDVGYSTTNPIISLSTITGNGLEANDTSLGVRLISDDGLYNNKIVPINITANRTSKLQNKSGTIALLSDITDSLAGYIPLPGTDVDKPLEGAIEFNPAGSNTALYSPDSYSMSIGSGNNADLDGGSTVAAYSKTATATEFSEYSINTFNNTTGVFLTLSPRDPAHGNIPRAILTGEAAEGFRGLTGSEDFSANITNLDYPQLIKVKSAIHDSLVHYPDSIRRVGLNWQYRKNGSWITYGTDSIGITNITGLITAGTNVTITGSGTSGSPYNISASGGGTNVVGANTYWLSKNSIPDDADISLNSSTFGTDGTSAIQAILNTSTSANPLTVYWDTHTSTTGLRIKSNTRIVFSPNCGVILRDNSDNWVFSGYNKNQSAISDSNIVIEGQGIINGNGFRGGSARQALSNSTHGEITAFFFAGTKNLQWKDFTILNSSSWATFCINTEDMLIERVTVNQGDTLRIVTDGFDFGSTLKNLVIRDCKLRTGDDHLGFFANTPGGTADGHDHTYYTNLNGKQSGIVLQNIDFDGGNWGVRFISSADTIERFYAKNLYGHTKSYWLIIDPLQSNGYTIAAGNGKVRDIVFDNINITIPSMAPFGNNTMQGEVILNSNIEDITFKHYVRNNFSVNGLPSINVQGDTVRNLNLIDYNSYDTTSSATFISHIMQSNGAIVRNLLINNAKVQAQKFKYSAILNAASGATNNIIVNGCLVDSIGAILYLQTAGSNVVASNIKYTSVVSSAPFQTISTTPNIVLSNYLGQTPTSGTFTTKTGDAFPSTASQWTTSGSDINYTIGAVTVGATSGAAKFNVYTTGSADGISLDGTTFPAIALRKSGSFKGYAPFLVTAPAGFFSSSVDGDMGFLSLSNNILFGRNGSDAALSVGTNVGVGLHDATEKLEVTGNAKVNGNIIRSGYDILPPAYFVPTTGSTISTTVGDNIIEPAGALLALTINLPSSPVSGMKVHYTFTQAITTVTFANGTTVNPITTTAAGGEIGWQYYSGTSSWYKY